MNAERLLALAAFLGTVPANRFDFAILASHSDMSASCGTNGCAIGWAPSLPLFRDLGMHLAPIPSVICPTIVVDRDGVTIARGIRAVCKEIFDLDEDETRYLFIPQSTEEEALGPGEVADRIRDFVSENS